jgi:hypothetical protein
MSRFFVKSEGIVLLKRKPKWSKKRESLAFPPRLALDWLSFSFFDCFFFFFWNYLLPFK